MALTQADDRHGGETWAEIEKAVQERAPFKDPDFRLEGKWKRPTGEDGDFFTYLVDVEWVRNNLNANFGHGGHGYVYEFIPHDEIWVSDRHTDCICLNIEDGQRISPEFYQSTVLHEITEYLEMRRGKTYKEAHEIALKREVEARILPDPYREY